MKQFVTICLVALSLIACAPEGKKQEETLLHKEDTLIFKTGFSFLDRPSGTFYNREIGERCYYFGNVATHKELRIFSEKGAPLFSIPIPVEAFGESIEEVEIWSMDTVLILSQYTGKLAFANRKGEIWKELHLLNELEGDSIWYFELTSSYYSAMNSSENSIVLSLNPAIQQEFRLSKGIQFYTEKVWSKPQLIRFDSLYSDTPITTIGFPMYQVIAPQDFSLLNIEVKSFVVTEKFIFAHSYYSDEVFVLDANSLELKTRHRLKSQYKSIGERATTKGKTDVEVITEIQQRKDGGMIARHFYNDRKKHHYFVISIDEEFWSLLICDESFQPLGEQQFSDRNYHPFLLPSAEGFYLQATSRGVSAYQPQQLTFHGFTY